MNAKGTWGKAPFRSRAWHKERCVEVKWRTNLGMKNHPFVERWLNTETLNILEVREKNFVSSC